MASNESILKTLQELMEKLSTQQEEISTLKTLLQTNGTRSSSLPEDPGSEGGATDSAPNQHLPAAAQTPGSWPDGGSAARRPQLLGSLQTHTLAGGVAVTIPATSLYPKSQLGLRHFLRRQSCTRPVTGSFPSFFSQNNESK